MLTQLCGLSPFSFRLMSLSSVVTSQHLRRLCSTWLLYVSSISMVTGPDALDGVWEAFTLSDVSAPASSTPPSLAWGRQAEQEAEEEGQVMEKEW